MTLLARPSASTRSLEHLPVTLFASVMGVGGLALAWRRASATWGVPAIVWQALLVTAAATFGLVALLYAAKWVRHPAAARAELQHPIRLAFAPTVTVALLVLATAAQDVAPGPARVAWWVGAVGHLIATVLVLAAWLTRPEIRAEHITPAWFIPVVGNVVTPLAAPTVGSVDLAWISFGVGAVAWLAVLPVVVFRLVAVDPPLPPRLQPTLAILLAPPAVMLLSLAVLTGRELDPVKRTLYGGLLVFVGLLAALARRLVALPFALSAWAYTFPLAATAAAAVAVDEMSGGGAAYRVVAVGVLAVATGVVAVVASLTLRAAARGEICVPE